MYSNKLLSLNIKSINPIQNYPYIIKSYACILYIFVVRSLFPIVLFFFLKYVQLQSSKTGYIINISIKSYPVNSYWFTLIKIYYIFKLISLINIIKFRFALIILLHFKIFLMMRWHQKSWPVKTVYSPALIELLPVNKFLSKLAPNVSSHIPWSPPFCFLTSFLIASLTHFINNPDYSRDLTIFIAPFISLFEIMNVVLSDLRLLMILLLLILMVLKRCQLIV